MGSYLKAKSGCFALKSASVCLYNSVSLGLDTQLESRRPSSWEEVQLLLKIIKQRTRIRPLLPQNGKLMDLKCFQNSSLKYDPTYSKLLYHNGDIKQVVHRNDQNTLGRLWVIREAVFYSLPFLCW